jgi:hypothetical protein
MQSIINLPKRDESNIIVELEKEHKPDDSFLCVNVDDSNSSEVSDGEIESEAFKNNSIF